MYGKRSTKEEKKNKKHNLEGKPLLAKKKMGNHPNNFKQKRVHNERQVYVRSPKRTKKKEGK